MSITSIALGAGDAANLLEEAKALAPDMPKLFIAMCTDEAEAQVYLTNLTNCEVSHLLYSCLLECHGVFGEDE